MASVKLDAQLLVQNREVPLQRSPQGLGEMLQKLEGDSGSHSPVSGG